MTNQQRCVVFYNVCLEWVQQNTQWTARMEDRRKRRLKDVDAKLFFEEYAGVVLGSGFKFATVVKKYDEGLWKALKEGDYAQVARNKDSVTRAALRYINYPRKINAIVDMASQLARGPLWANLQAELLKTEWTVENQFRQNTSAWNSSDVKRVLQGALNPLRAFPFIGKVTQYELAKNIGLDVPKPDRQMRCAAQHCGLPATEEGVLDLVWCITQATNERPGVIDYVIWRYMVSS
ncbi:MAG: hypothetical protein V1724_03085 [Chloroflexota bacterium]